MVVRYIGSAILIVFFNLISAFPNFADTIYLKGGHVEEGEIIEDADFYIAILDPESLSERIIYKALVERIDSDKHIDLNTWKKSTEGTPDAQEEWQDNIKEKLH